MQNRETSKSVLGSQCGISEFAVMTTKTGVLNMSNSLICLRMGEISGFGKVGLFVMISKKEGRWSG